MPYRNDSEASRAREEALSAELDRVRAQSQALASREATLARELDDVRALRSAEHGAGRERRPDRGSRARAPLAAMVGASAYALLGVAAIVSVMQGEVGALQVHGAVAYEGASSGPGLRAEPATEDGRVEQDGPVPPESCPNEPDLGTVWVFVDLDAPGEVPPSPPKPPRMMSDP